MTEADFVADAILFPNVRLLHNVRTMNGRETKVNLSAASKEQVL